MLDADYKLVDPSAVKDQETGELPPGIFKSIYEGIKISVLLLVEERCFSSSVMNLMSHSCEIWWKGYCD
jgi:hypothetical protein